MFVAGDLLTLKQDCLLVRVGDETIRCLDLNEKAIYLGVESGLKCSFLTHRGKVWTNLSYDQFCFWWERAK